MSNKSGFTLIEILVSLLLVGALILVVSNLLVPLALTRASNIQSQGLAMARSYVELVKARWQVRATYNAASLPTASDTSSTADIKLPTGWALQTPGSSSWVITDTIRTLKVIVQPAGTVNSTNPNLQKQWVTLQVLITAPS